jgi:hypothetical protein
LQAAAASKGKKCGQIWRWAESTANLSQQTTR